MNAAPTVLRARLRRDPPRINVATVNRAGNASSTLSPFPSKELASRAAETWKKTFGNHLSTTRKSFREKGKTSFYLNKKEVSRFPKHFCFHSGPSREEVAHGTPCDVSWHVHTTRPVSIMYSELPGVRGDSGLHIGVGWPRVQATSQGVMGARKCFAFAAMFKNMFGEMFFLF